MALTKIGATLGGSADVITVTQASHGLTLGYPVKMGSNSNYAHATADSAANAEVVGIIIATTTNTLTIALGGRITVDGCVPNVTAGTVLFLQVSAGLLAATEPSSAGQISKPMAVVTVANSEMIMVQQRGEVISTGGASIADESITNAKLSHMAANTVKVRDANSSGDPSDKAVADTQILIGDGTGFTAAALSGDVTMANDGAVTIAANAVNSAEIVAGAIDLAHMSSESVDEDNLHISNVGNNGEFLSKQSGNAGGLTWAVAGTPYEAGTWTPAISGSSYTTQIGRYVKIGKMVHVSAELNINSHGGSVRRVTGLPFPSADSSHVTSLNVSYFSGLAVNVLWIGCYVENNASTLQFPNMTSAGAVVTSAAADIWGNSARVNFSGTYEAAS